MPEEAVREFDEALEFSKAFSMVYIRRYEDSQQLHTCNSGVMSFVEP